jgi:hypothetical protein
LSGFGACTAYMHVHPARPAVSLPPSPPLLLLLLTAGAVPNTCDCRA